MSPRPQRGSEDGNGDAPKPKRSAASRRTWPQRFVLALLALQIIACLGAAGGLAFYQKQWADVPRLGLQSTLDAQESTAEPQNFLLVGADNAEGLDTSDPVIAGRNIREMLTDTIMILRVDPNQQKAWLLSLPRDLWVDIAGNHGKERINAALSLGGPQLLIETIKQDFGIPINHFIQINFYGFKKLVETVEGVPVYFNYPARDGNTGLNVTEAGCKLLDGDQALGFARSRHYTAFVDGRWVEDPTSDHGRIARQQYFIKQAGKRAIEKGARNPIQLNNLVGVAQQYVVLDDTLTPEQILDLAARFNEYNPEDLQVFEPPTRGGTVGAASVLFLLDQQAQPIFDIFRGVNPTLNVAAAIRVEVRNGTGKASEAQAVGADLRKAGFTVTSTVDAKTFRNDQTVVTYAPGALFQAVVLARYLDVNAPLQEDPALADTDHAVALVVGKDFTGVRTDPRPIEDFATYLPQLSTTTTAPDAAAPTTSSTVPPPSERSFVPEPPPGVEC